MALAAQLQSLDDNFQKNGPKPLLEIINGVRENIPKEWDDSKPLKEGDKFPSFELPNAVGESVSSKTLLQKGPLLITFYRGEWCPFCNLALASFQKHIDSIHDRGVELVAISPELPNTSMTTTEKHALKYPVLTDENLAFTRQLGIVWEQPQSMRTVFERNKTDIVKRTGHDSLAVPIPATFLVGQDGIIVKAYADPDYTKRIEPRTAVEWIDSLNVKETNSH